MFGWGIAFMVIGGLSFVLPMFGRQFILVSAIGLTGVGSAFAGIILFLAGIALFVAAGKVQRSESADVNRFGERPRQPMNATSAATKVLPICEAEEVPLHSGFYLNNEGPIAPFNYGFEAVKQALEASSKKLKEIAESCHSVVKEKIVANQGPVQLHLIALHVAAWYVCAQRCCSADRLVLTDVGSGISSGMAAIFSKDGTATELSQFMYELFKEYSQSLFTEINHPNTDNPFDQGVTADLVTKYLGKQLGIEELLQKSSLEKTHMFLIIYASGIPLLRYLLLEKRVEYK